jgi:ArsR family transcriptional regulator
MELVEIFKAFGDETRIRILNLLRNSEMCVCEIEAILGINQSNASRHLNKLKSTGIIDYDKKAQWVYYKMDENFIKEYPLLYEFFCKEVEKDSKCIYDLKKWNELKKCNLGCKEIEKDKGNVLKQLGKVQ